MSGGEPRKALWEDIFKGNGRCDVSLLWKDTGQSICSQCGRLMKNVGSGARLPGFKYAIFELCDLGQIMCPLSLNFPF